MTCASTRITAIGMLNPLPSQTAASFINLAPTCISMTSRPTPTNWFPSRSTSDPDQEREKWIKNPMDYLTGAHLSPDGDRIVPDDTRRSFSCARRTGGRFVNATHEPTVRYRAATFMQDGKSLLALSDAHRRAANL